MTLAFYGEPACGKSTCAVFSEFGFLVVVDICDSSYYSMPLPGLQILADKDIQPLINGSEGNSYPGSEKFVK